MPRTMALAALVSACLPGLDQDARTEGERVLASVDDALNRARTLILEVEIIHEDGPGLPERRQARTIQAKGGKRWMETTAPAKSKGVRFLYLSATEIHYYLPSTGKVFRLTSETANKGLMDPIFTFHDFFVTRYADDYAARLSSDSPGACAISLAPKEGRKPPYPRIELEVLKDEWVPTTLRYLDDAGTVLKIETRQGYTREGEVLLPSEIVMKGTGREVRRTRMIRKACKIDQDIPDGIFDPANLGK